MIDKRIIFDEKHENEAFETTIMYFTGPKDLINKKYPEAESMEISVEVPTKYPDAENATVSFSPTKDGLDYDWHEITIPLEDIDALIKLANNTQLR